MDQPNTSDDKELQNTPQDSGMPQDTPVSDDSTPINVTVQSDNDSQVTDSVMDGVPSASDTSEPVVETPSVEVAEEVVAEAMPQSTADELAAVASELESMSASDTPVDQPVPPAPTAEVDENDPMTQIMQEASEATGSEPYTEPAEPMVTDTSSDVADSEENTPAEEQPQTDAAPDVGSMETENEYGERSDTPTEDAQPSEAMGMQDALAEQSPEAQPEAPTSEVSSEDTAADSNQPSGTVDSATQEDQSAPVTMDVSEAPSYSAPENTPEEPATPTEEAPASQSEVNDVVTPSVVAAAVAAGTSGDNAITGTPESSSVGATGGPVPAQTMPKQKSGKGMIVLVVALVTLLFGGGAVAAYMMQPEETDEPTTSESSDEATREAAAETDSDEQETTETATPGEKVEAKALDDYKAACSAGGMITNATAYAGASPHPLVVFEKGSDDKFAQSLVSFKDTTWAASASKVTGGQLVACIARKVGSEVKLKDCPITDSVTKVTADVAFHSSKYTVDVYEALTGKKVTSFENSSISTTCPTNASYNKADPKIYAVFDQVALETSLKDVVTKAL